MLRSEDAANYEFLATLAAAAVKDNSSTRVDHHGEIALYERSIAIGRRDGKRGASGAELGDSDIDGDSDSDSDDERNSHGSAMTKLCFDPALLAPLSFHPSKLGPGIQVLCDI